MAVKRVILFTAGAFAVAIVARKVVVSRQPSISELGAGRWRVVTVYVPKDRVAPDGQYPQPLQELGDLVDIRVSDAPGGKGTELAARLRSGEPTGALGMAGRVSGNDPRQAVRRALRESKQLLETGEVIRLDPKPEGHRPHTPTGALVDVISERSMGEGVL
jgi:hypothetical protein